MTQFTLAEAVERVRHYTHPGGHRNPPGTGLEAAAECVGRSRETFESFEAWIGLLRDLPGRYLAGALIPAWPGLPPAERAAVRDIVKAQAAAHRPEAAIWLAGLLSAADPDGAGLFASIAAGAVGEEPNKTVRKTLQGALVGRDPPTPLERLAARPTQDVFRLWTALHAGDAWRDVPAALLPGTLAVGVTLAGCAKPHERPHLLADIARTAATLPPPGRAAVVAAAATPEAAAALHRELAPPEEGTSAGPSVPRALLSVRRLRDHSANGALGGPGPLAPASPAAGGPAGRPAAAPVAVPPAPADDGPGAGDGGVAAEAAVEAALETVRGFVAARRAERRDLQRLQVQLQEATADLVSARRAGEDATAQCQDLAARLAEQERRGLEVRAHSERLEAELQSLHGFADQRFRAGGDQLAAQLAADLGLDLDHVRRFAEAGERTPGEQHLLRLIDGIVRTLSRRGVVVTWR